MPRAEISLIIARYGVANQAPPDLLPLAMMVMLGTALIPGILVRFPRGTARRRVTEPGPEVEPPGHPKP